MASQPFTMVLAPPSPHPATLIEAGQVVSEAATAPLKDAKEANPQWPDQLQLRLGAGTVRPPHLYACHYPYSYP